MAGIMQDLAGALLMPDAQSPDTVQFITDIMAQIQKRATAPYAAQAEAGQLPPSADNGLPMQAPPGPMASPGGPPPGMMGGGMGGPPMGGGLPPMPQGPVPPGAGMPSQSPSINPDELRRILGTGAR